MCYYTFLNEKLLQRYTFFMIYANLFAKKCGEATILCESVNNVKASAGAPAFLLTIVFATSFH